MRELFVSMEEFSLPFPKFVLTANSPQIVFVLIVSAGLNRLTTYHRYTEWRQTSVMLILIDKFKEGAV